MKPHKGPLICKEVKTHGDVAVNKLPLFFLTNKCEHCSDAFLLAKPEVNITLVPSTKT